MRNKVNQVLINGVILSSVAISLLIDDFLFGIPVEFVLTNIQAQILAGVFTAMLIVVFLLVARGHRWGFIGAGLLGGFLALAGILKHVPLLLQPGHYWSGLFSEFLIWALIVSGVTPVNVSCQAIRSCSS